MLVVDSSGGEIDDWIRASFPRVRIVPYGKRLYPGAARNLGVDCSRGAMLAFIDSDIVLSEDWLETMLASQHARETDMGMTSGAVINDNPESVASRVLYWIEFSEFLPGLPAGPRTALSSCNLLIPRERFQSIGGFRTDLEMFEDFEFSYRIPDKPYFESAARVSHHHRSRWAAVLQHLRRLGFWSGKVRSEGKSGASSRAVPGVLLPLLPVYRFFRILSRIFRSGYGEGFRALLHAPFLMLGLIFWTIGFFHGFREQALLHKSEAQLPYSK